MFRDEQNPQKDRRTDKRRKGDDKERLAETFLINHDFQLIERNFSCKSGEIDLIMKHKDYLVFVEVRYRETSEFGGPLSSITRSKQSKLRRTAEYYLLTNFGNTPPPCRFDAIGISGEDQIEWVENAF